MTTRGDFRSTRALNRRQLSARLPAREAHLFNQLPAWKRNELIASIAGRTGEGQVAELLAIIRRDSAALERTIGKERPIVKEMPVPESPPAPPVEEAKPTPWPAPQVPRERRTRRITVKAVPKPSAVQAKKLMGADLQEHLRRTRKPSEITVEYWDEGTMGFRFVNAPPALYVDMGKRKLLKYQQQKQPRPADLPDPEAVAETLKRKK